MIEKEFEIEILGEKLRGFFIFFLEVLFYILNVWKNVFIFFFDNLFILESKGEEG